MSAACNAFKDDNHAFVIYDMPTGESASIPYFWGKQKPAFTTNRLYLGSVNTLTAWLQMYNAIETSLYQNKTTLIFDFNKDQFITQEVHQLAYRLKKRLKNGSGFFKNTPAIGNHYDNFEMVHSKRGLIYWDLSSGIVQSKCQLINDFTERLALLGRKCSDISVVFVNIDELASAEQGCLIDTINKCVSLHLNIALSTSPFQQSISKAAHRSGFSQIVLEPSSIRQGAFDFEMTLETNQSLATPWGLSDWRSITLPLPMFIQEKVIEPILISV
jgi:hypothetical protein